MTTIVIDERSEEGKAFIELLRKMRFAEVLNNPGKWWNTVSPGERLAIKQGLEDVENGKTVSHEEMRTRYERWLQN